MSASIISFQDAKGVQQSFDPKDAVGWWRFNVIGDDIDLWQLPNGSYLRHERPNPWSCEPPNTTVLDPEHVVDWLLKYSLEIPPPLKPVADQRNIANSRLSGQDLLAAFDPLKNKRVQINVSRATIWDLGHQHFVQTTLYRLPHFGFFIIEDNVNVCSQTPGAITWIDNQKAGELLMEHNLPLPGDIQHLFADQIIDPDAKVHVHPQNAPPAKPQILGPFFDERGDKHTFFRYRSGKWLVTVDFRYPADTCDTKPLTARAVVERFMHLGVVEHIPDDLHHLIPDPPHEEPGFHSPEPEPTIAADDANFLPPAEDDWDEPRFEVDGRTEFADLEDALSLPDKVASLKPDTVCSRAAAPDAKSLPATPPEVMPSAASKKKQVGAAASGTGRLEDINPPAVHDAKVYGILGKIEENTRPRQRRKRTSSNDDRDRYCYYQREKGATWEEIMTAVNANNDWDFLSTPQAVCQAAKRYAQRQNPPLKWPVG